MRWVDVTGIIGIKGKKNVEAVRSEQSENPRYKYKAESGGEEDKNKKKKKGEN